jgi:hypothetical protein
MQRQLVGVLVMCAGVSACTPKVIQLESLQNAFQEKAAAECRYETADKPERYGLCMRAKGAAK